MEPDNLKNIIVKQITSGRWILTVIGGGVFAYVSITGMLSNEATASILTAIFMSYFQRPDRNGQIKKEDV